MAVTVGPLDVAHAEAAWRLSSQAFGGQRPFNLEAMKPLEDTIGIIDGAELVASGRSRPAGQWFGGRLVSCGCVAGVSVAAHRRGEALGLQLMTAVLDKMHTDGFAISALYPTTALLYRKLGWEIAGDYAQRKLPLALLASAQDLGADVTVRTGTDADLADQQRLHSAMGAQANGWLERDHHWWRRLPLRPSGGVDYFYMFERNGTPVGYLRMHAVDSTANILDLRVDDIVAADPGAMAAVARLLSGFTMVAGHITLDLPRHLLALLTPQPQRVLTHFDMQWMLRLINATDAIAQRGWPLGLTVEVPLHIIDPQLAGNDGPHVLTIAGGQGTLEPGGSGEVRVGIGHLSAWYSGFVSAETLATQGHLTGGTAQQLAALTMATAGQAPALNEFF